MLVCFFLFPMVLSMKSASPICDKTELPFLFAGKNEKMTAHRQQPGQDLTEEELARYVQELQKHQVSMRLGRSVCLQKVSPCLRCSLCFCHFEASVRWRSSVRRDLSCLRGEIQVWGFEEKNNVVTAQGWTKDVRALPNHVSARLHFCAFFL